MSQPLKKPNNRSAISFERYIRTLEEENDQLTHEIVVLRERIKDLQEQLHTIHQSRTFRAWQSYVGVRKQSKRKTKQVISMPVNQAKELTPLWLRKRIKTKLQRLLLPKVYKLEIKKEIRGEWKNWQIARSDGSFDILVFGITKYDFRFQRPQHLAREFQQLGHRIFYIENEFILASQNQATFAPFRVTRVQKNIYKIIIASYENLFIYHDMLSERNKGVMMASIRSLIREAAIVNPVAKFDHPFWGSLADTLSMPIIYDCMDEHKGFKHSSLNLGKIEQELIHCADLTIASSDYLYKKVKQIRPRELVQIKNAGEYAHFRHAVVRHFKQPKDIAPLPRPIIGYYGAIADWMDDTIIKQLAQNFPNASIVLIGKIDNKRIARLAASCKNLHLLGERPYQDLPKYLQEFDVCLIPFIVNDLIKATSPVKIYEYLASGKPIVVTDIPELESYKNVLYLAKNATEFSQLVEKALDEENDKLIAKRQEVAKANTWQMRALVLDKKMRQLFFPKVSVIVLTYFKPEYTKLCLDSILYQSKYPNLELIIVDNASDKVTVNLVNSYKNDNRVKITLNKVNTGFAKGNNIGMMQATGDYIIVFNNDAVVTPGWISRLVFHARKPKVGLVGPVTNGIGNEAKIEIDYDKDKLTDMIDAARVYTSQHWGETLQLNNLAAFCWILSKSLYTKIGGFDQTYGKAYFEDDDYCMMVKKEDLKLLCADDVFIHHYWGSVHKSVDEFLQMENKKRFEKKWGVTWQPHKYRNQ